MSSVVGDREPIIVVISSRIFSCISGKWERRKRAPAITALVVNTAIIDHVVYYNNYPVYMLETTSKSSQSRFDFNFSTIRIQCLWQSIKPSKIFKRVSKWKKLRYIHVLIRSISIPRTCSSVSQPLSGSSAKSRCSPRSSCMKLWTVVLSYVPFKTKRNPLVLSIV